MANDVPEIRIALFGQSGSGKTTFLASYYGNQQHNSFEQAHGYRLRAADLADGHQLLGHYYRMEEGRFPEGTNKFHEYRFDFMVSGLREPALSIVWYDYPGGWWEQTPKDDAEKAERRDALAKLLQSHVGILLIDGRKYRSEGIRYVQKLFGDFRLATEIISSELALSSVAQGSSLPTQWILAISKADLFPDNVTAEKVCKEIVFGAAYQLAGLAKQLNPKSFGNQYLLVSSVRGDGNRVIDAHQFIGLQLVAPVALVSVLSELAEKAGQGTGYGMLHTILKTLSDVVDWIDKLDNFLPAKYQMLTRLLKALALKEGLDKGAQHFREKQAAAVRKKDALTAAANAFRAELASEAAQHAFYRNQN